MELELNAHEARVLGVLVEKTYTTPEQYPLSLNAATNGCNQKSNRDPRLEFSEAEVTVALKGLQMKHLVGSSFQAGGRVEKWMQTAKGHLSIGDEDLAVLAELLLRGPQAPGELRARASRMRTLANLEALGHALARLLDKGYVRRLSAGAGARAERYAQLLAPELHPDGPAAPGPPATPEESPPRPARADASGALAGRVEGLEERIATLERQLSTLAEKLGEPL